MLNSMVIPMHELVYEVTQEADGGFVAKSLDECVITQADTLDELRHNVREAVQAYFSTPPKFIHFTSYVTNCSGADETVKSVSGLGTGLSNPSY